MCCCDEFIHQFELTELLRSVIGKYWINSLVSWSIIKYLIFLKFKGVSKINGVIEYATLLKLTKNRIDMFPALEVALYGQQKLITFLENAVDFIMPTQRGNLVKINLSNNEVNGKPTEILGMTVFYNHFLYNVDFLLH